MKAVLYLSTNDREQEMGRALTAGFNIHGVECIAKTRGDFWASGGSPEEAVVDDDADIVGFIGVKSRKMFTACTMQGKVPLLIDKGYFGRGEYYRMSLGSYQPAYLDKINGSPKRFYDLVPGGVQPARRHGNSIMYIGSSQKYCNFHELGDNNDYSRAVLTLMKDNWSGNIIYRPKPSWWAKTKAGERRDNMRDLGVEFSGPDVQFAKVLNRCYAVVTHGSNGAAEALAAGIPVIMLSEPGVSPVLHLCEPNMESLRKPHAPYMPSVEKRQHTLFAMAWCQFTVPEMAAGLAWSQLMRWMPGHPHLKVAS